MSKGAKRGVAWKPSEDVALCIAVVTIGEDGATANKQASQTLWERIHEVYLTVKPIDGDNRSGGGCESRWRKIRPACQRWHEALTMAAAARASGENALDEEIQAKSAYLIKSKGHEFEFAHCWPILKDTPKFSNPPCMNFSSGPSPINLEQEDTQDDCSPSRSSVHARPLGQKAQKAAKKKAAQTTSSELLIQMQRIADQGNVCDLEHRQRLREEAQLVEQRADDAVTMAVDPSIYTPRKKGYWERKQARIIEREEEDYRSRPYPQPTTSSQAPSTQNEDNFLDSYVPVQETQWMGGN